MMLFHTTKEHEEFRGKIRAFAEKEIKTHSLFSGPKQ